MRYRLWTVTALLAGATARAAAAPLLLDDVLLSAQRSYPLLKAAVQEQAIAEGKALRAEGAFDAKLSVKSGTNQFGFYKNRVYGGGVAQPLGDWGGEIFGGYKRGQGNFGPWEEDLLTLSRGEWSGGVRLPLLRDRQTDERRTALRLARLAVELADASVEKQRLKLLEAAAKSYWQWVSAGKTLAVAEALLELAEARNRQVEEFVQEGEVAEIEIADNQRAVLERRAAVVSAERSLQNANLELSLFYRDEQGGPQRVERDRLPEFPEPKALSAAQIEADLKLALERRPEIEGLLVELRQSGASLGLARNQLLPQIDVTARYRADSGTGSITKQGGEFVAGVLLTTPFQRRKAKGSIAMQEAKLEQLRQKLRFARDRIEVEVRDAASALRLALQRLDLAQAESEVAQRLAEAERERFELGDSTLFVVNLRELSAAGANLKIISALAECHKATAVYRAYTAAL